MKLLKQFMFVILIISILTTLFVDLQRIRWEEGYKTVEIAVYAQDIHELTGQSNYPLDTLLEDLSRMGVVSIIVEPAELEELSIKTALQDTETDEGELSVDLIDRIKGSSFKVVLSLKELRYSDDLSSILHKFVGLDPQLVILPNGRHFEDDDQLAVMLELPEAQEITVGLVEFAEAKEAMALYRQGFERFVRAHTIKPEELEKMEMGEALGRWERAVRERNIRLLLVRFIEGSIDYNLGYLEQLSSRLVSDGFELRRSGSPHSFKENNWALIPILLGAISLGVISLNKVWELRQQNDKHRVITNLMLWTVGVAVALAGIYFQQDLTKKTFALGVAILAPVSSYLFLSPYLERGHKASTLNANTPALQHSGSLKRGFRGLLSLSACTLLGGLGVGAILGSSEFFLKIEQFRGVKLALFLPLALVFLLYFVRQGLPEFKSFWNKEIKLGELILLGLGGIIMFLILVRSGNFTVIPVSGVEERIRTVLEGSLYARPRFKEFLLGHPLLFLWAALGHTKLREYSIVVLLLGMVGQVSIISSFAHLHTPLLLSLFRTVNGLILGMAIGVVLLVIFIWGDRWWKRLARS